MSNLRGPLENLWVETRGGICLSQALKPHPSPVTTNKFSRGDIRLLGTPTVGDNLRREKERKERGKRGRKEGGQIVRSDRL